MEARTMNCEGRLVATAELADTYGYDCDGYDHLFLFQRDGGYELLVVGRAERYADDGHLVEADARVDVTFEPTVTALAELVDARWPKMSNAWWQVLDSARQNDPTLHAAWIPERMRRDLDGVSVHDRSLATQSGYFNGTVLPAKGRGALDWQDKAVEAMGAHLDALGWKVRLGPDLSPDVDPGGILSVGTVVLGSLWASRFGQEAAVIVRVDDCGEIYARLAEPEDLLDQKVMGLAAVGAPPDDVPWPARRDEDRRTGTRDPIPVGDAIDALLQRPGDATPGLGFGL